MGLTASDIAALAVEVLAALGHGLDADELTAVRRALDLASDCHVGQQRDDGTPYMLHPLRTALILARELGVRDAIAVCAALLHDTLEDQCSVSLDDIRRLFGAEVASIIEAVTKPHARGRSHGEVNAIYFPRLRAADELVRTVKLADRLDNIRDLPNSQDRAKRRRMIDETRLFYMPLIDTLTDPRRREVLAGAFSQAIEVVEKMAHR